MSSSVSMISPALSEDSYCVICSSIASYSLFSFFISSSIYNQIFLSAQKRHIHVSKPHYIYQFILWSVQKRNASHLPYVIKGNY